MEKQVFYYVYKITNNQNGKFYIGAHKTKNLEDGYFGSGVVLKESIKKYGRENFTKEILKFSETESEMYDAEKELVIISETSYNMTLGGRGGFSHIDNFGENNPMRKSFETRKKVSEAVKIKRNNPERKKYYDDISRENLKKAVDKNTGTKRPEHSKFMREWAKNNWSANKEKIRNSLSSDFEIICPEGNIYKTNRLQEFCTEHNLSYTTLWNTSRTQKPSTKGRSKGWICRKVE
jgi:hypothetical protein